MSMTAPRSARSPVAVDDLSTTIAQVGDVFPDVEPDTRLDAVGRETRGEAVERLMCDVLDLEYTEPLDDEPDVFDARFVRPGGVLDGRPGEIKSCLPWLETTGGRRRGRFWINRDPHDELVARDGVYVFTVVDPASTIVEPRVLEYATVPATDAFTEWCTWSPCGRRHPVERSAQFPHAKLFPDLRVDQGADV